MNWVSKLKNLDLPMLAPANDDEWRTLVAVAYWLHAGWTRVEVMKILQDISTQAMMPESAWHDVPRTAHVVALGTLRAKLTPNTIGELAAIVAEVRKPR